MRRVHKEQRQFLLGWCRPRAASATLTASAGGVPARVIRARGVSMNRVVLALAGVVVLSFSPARRGKATRAGVLVLALFGLSLLSPGHNRVAAAEDDVVKQLKELQRPDAPVQDRREAVEKLAKIA